jgi:hypothetical protein
MVLHRPRWQVSLLGLAEDLVAWDDEDLAAWSERTKKRWTKLERLKPGTRFGLRGKAGAGISVCEERDALPVEVRNVKITSFETMLSQALRDDDDKEGQCTS